MSLQCHCSFILGFVLTAMCVYISVYQVPPMILQTVLNIVILHFSLWEAEGEQAKRDWLISGLIITALWWSVFTHLPLADGAYRGDGEAFWESQGGKCMIHEKQVNISACSSSLFDSWTWMEFLEPVQPVTIWYPSLNEAITALKVSGQN